VPVTTADLQAVFEETSGEDLSDFFDFWVHGGRFPKVTLNYALEEREDGKKDVFGCIDSDIPFGSWDVPVAVEDEKGKVAALVDVDDGQGQFEVPGRTGDVEVVLDPTNQLVYYGVSVKSVSSKDKLSCAASAIE
jgi:aminopeptidase N